MIQNENLINDTLDKLSNQKAAKSVSRYDFGTWHINIPYNKLINTLNSEIDFTFKGRNQDKIPISYYGITNWYKSFKYFVFDISSLQEEYPIRNCYFVIENQVFQKIVGTIMWSDPAPIFF